MGYQALLFCPDEKTARTVTQVLSELDFSVTPCTEPFGAVKKLMAERFDAVVVDCDNEQNATLLFKSARNAPNNQSALAVAVVEGQAGVAKAFRIGANLVLTKPINVEQAKGTLRVARGLLRKGEAAKPAPTAASAAAKPAPPVTPPATAATKPPQVTPSVLTPRPAVPVAPPATMVPAPKPTPQTTFSVSASSAIKETAESAGLGSTTSPAESAAPISATPKIAPAAVEPKPEVAPNKPQVVPPSSAGLPLTTSTGAATAAAPAREAKSETATSAQTSTAIPAEILAEAAASVSDSPVAEAASSSPAPTFTFGGTVGRETESASGGSKKILLAVAAVVLIAAAGYFGWTQWAHANGAAGVSAPVAARPATVAPAAAPSATAIAPSAVSSSTTASAPSSTGSFGTSSGTSAIPSSTAASQPVAPATTSSLDATPGATNSQAHQNKSNSSADSPKTAGSVVAANKAPAKAVPVAAEPMVIKNGTSQPVAGKAEPIADAPAPSIDAIAPAGGPLPNLMSGAGTTQTPVLQVVNVSQGVSQGLVIKRVSPSYPPNSLRMHVEGAVTLLATISKTGDISSVKILSGDAGLARAAADAVKQWKYKPYLLDGAPVEIQTQVTVNFKLPK
jgi:TonB family protein